MQPGILRRSQLLDSLKDYLNNKGRLQPIIGLGSLTECVKAGAQSREALYLCGVCVCRHSKADIRNHILGSLHRFNYIKTWHPHLVSKWQESSDLSKLAWPLMEMAKKLEEKEGPGEIQLLEVEDDVYQRMATSSETDAVTLINSLRDIQGEIESYSETTALYYPTESQRTVVLAQGKSRWSQKSLKADTDSYRISAHTNKTPPLLMHANVDPSPNSEVCLVNAFTSQLDAPAPPALSEINSSFLDDYAGSKPLIGLNCVVECRSEGGSSYCWLCHCCRIRANKKDIIDHLTSSSHLVNYLMETHSKEVEEMAADSKGRYQLLQSLAKKVDQKMGRGDLKVVCVPETLCTLLTGKSYHWCIKMLQGEWKPANIQKKGIEVNGPSVNQTSAGVMPEKCALMKTKSKKRGKAKWKTVFNVSLPLTKGLMLLKRTSFNRDSLPVSPPSDSDLTSGSEIVDCELECYNISFEFNNAEMSALQRDLCSGVADAGMNIPEGNFTVTQFQNSDDCVSDGGHFGQSEDITGTVSYKGYWKSSDNRYNDVYYKKWKNEEMQNEALFPAGSSVSSYRHGEGWTDQEYNLASENKDGPRVEELRGGGHKDLSSDAGQYYYLQHFQKPYTPYDDRNLQTGGVGGHCYTCRDVAPCINGTTVNMPTCSVDGCMYCGSIAPCSDLTNVSAQAAPQNCGPQPTAYEASQGHHGWMSYPSLNTGPRMNPDQRFLPPVCSRGNDWSLTHSNDFSQPCEPQCAGSHANFYFS